MFDEAGSNESQDYGEPEEEKQVLPDLPDFSFQVKGRSQTSPHARLIRLAEREWPNHLLHLCSGDYEEAFYLHTKSGYVYMIGAGYGETEQGERAATNLYRQADSLEAWFERWLAGTMQNVYPRE